MGVRGGVHASGGEIVEVVVGQDHAADQDGDDAAHVKGFGDDVAEDAKEVGDDYLCDFVVDEEAAGSEEEGAEESWMRDGVPQAAPIPREEKTVSRNFQSISRAIYPPLMSSVVVVASATISPEWGRDNLRL